jgi:ferritin-like protein
LRAYTDAVERAFGAAVDYGSIVKTFSHSDLEEQRRYSPPEVMNVKRIPVAGSPVVDLISTSHVEKQNHTLRMHCRRLTRLTMRFPRNWKTLRPLSRCTTPITTS